MDKNKQIEELLNKYWECNTSLEDESVLQDYFLHYEDIPEHLQVYKALFAYQQEEREQTLSESFEERLMKKIKQPERKFFNPVSNFLKIAACFLLCIGLVFWIYQNKEMANITANEDSLENVEDSREMVMKALCLISDNMQKGENVVNESFKYFDLLQIRDSVKKSNTKINN